MRGCNLSYGLVLIMDGWMDSVNFKYSQIFDRGKIKYMFLVVGYMFYFIIVIFILYNM